MKKILKVVFLSSFLLISLINPVYAETQERVYSADLQVATYGTIKLAFLYEWDTSNNTKEFIRWTHYRVDTINGNTCWYISRDVYKNGSGLKMVVTAQGYNYNTRLTSPVYTFTKYIT